MRVNDQLKEMSQKLTNDESDGIIITTVVVEVCPGINKTRHRARSDVRKPAMRSRPKV